MSFKIFKGGKLPPAHKATHLTLSDFADNAKTWPAVPASGLENKVNPNDWGMLGNDQWGCCAAAGIMHLIQAQSANSGSPLHSTTDQTLELYSAVTGFNIKAGPSGNNPTDNGTVLTELLTYIKKNGLPMFDINNKEVIVDIVGWAALDTTSLLQTRWAAFTFGGLYEGIGCPVQCEENTENWNFAPGLPLAGGHCIPRISEGGAGGKIISWAKVIPTSNEFILGYRDEGYVVMTKAWLNAQGKSPTGLDLNSMVAASKLL
jgi:hypothetical protein